MVVLSKLILLSRRKSFPICLFKILEKKHTQLMLDLISLTIHSPYVTWNFNKAYEFLCQILISKMESYVYYIFTGY